MISVRRQASLYLTNVPDIEEARNLFNPAQAQLIPAHVTLCRENEVTDWPKLASRLEQQQPICLEMRFGAPLRDGNFVYLPALAGTEHFDQVRHQLLWDEGQPLPRKQMPHITIIHPRNGACTDGIFQELTERLQPFTAILREVWLIEQLNGRPWRTIV